MLFKTPLAWLQLTKERGRFLSALVGIAFADMLMFMQLGFQLAGYYSQSAMHRHLNADLVLISAKTVSIQAMHSGRRGG
jgi:putative ABC transport system permease protein